MKDKFSFIVNEEYLPGSSNVNSFDKHIQVLDTDSCANIPVIVLFFFMGSVIITSGRPVIPDRDTSEMNNLPSRASLRNGSSIVFPGLLRVDNMIFPSGQ